MTAQTTQRRAGRAPQPLRWLLELAVRLLHAPAVRRRLLERLYTDNRDERGRRRKMWTVPAPALGARCVPGCVDGNVDWSGVHLCKVEIGTVQLPSQPYLLGMTHGAVVEVTQDQDEDGRVHNRRVWLIGLDREGGYADNGMQLDAETMAALVELLDTALVVAGERPAHHGYSSHSAAGGAR